VEDPLDRAYNLEISSPGIDRPLVRKSDFADALGHLAKVETSVTVEGRKRFRGTIAEVGDDWLVIERETAPAGEDPRVRIPFGALGEARLILTDDLIRDALRKDKKIRQERRKQRRSQAGEEPGGDTGQGQAN
jgi:ribosome maturation factor RimP